MRRNLIVLSALVLTMVSAGALSAQGRRGGMMGRMGGLRLLSMEPVQKELKMTPAQIDKVNAKQQEVRAQIRDLVQSGGSPQSMSAEDREKFMMKVMEIQHKAVSDILDGPQMKRFDQLELQRQGLQALTRKDVADKLKLSDDQRNSVADILQKAEGERQAALQGKGFQNLTDEDRQKLESIHKSTDQKIKAVLSEDQQKQWKEMHGEPFHFGPPPSPPRPQNSA